MTPSPHSFAVSVVEQLQQAGHVAMFAGGCVRDMLLARSDGADPDDYDVATDATPKRVRELFGKRQTLAVGEAFGVIIVLGPKVRHTDGEQRHLQVEVATFRAEGEYTDGRRPDNVVFCNAEEDAARRDFTINGMFYDPVSDRVADYVGGQQDLERGVIRAIGDPHARIAEDKLRMLRAIRFTARFGFSLDEETRRAVKQHAPEITVVSWERITQELSKILTHTSRSTGIRLLLESGLLRHILPEALEDERDHAKALAARLQALDRLTQPRLVSALTVLLNTETQNANPVDTAAQLARRLKLSNDDRKQLCWLVENRRFARTFSKHSLAEQKTVLSNKHAAILLDVANAEASGHSEAQAEVDSAKRFLQQTPGNVLNPAPLISGDDLVSLGLKPGPSFKETLTKIRTMQLNEEITTRDEAIAIVQSR